MRCFYISGIEYDDDLRQYGNSFERIVKAPSKSKAKEKLGEYYNLELITIYNIHETTEDAMV